MNSPSLSGPQPAPQRSAGAALLFARVFRRLRLSHRAPAFQVEFRPFAGLRSSIALRGHRAEVDLSDIFCAAPPLVLEALAEILLSHAFRRRPSREARECYLAYVFSPPVRRRANRVRRKRVRSSLLPPQGRFYDLQKIFNRLNRRHFGGRLFLIRIGWSKKALRSVFGHYDSSRRLITISRGLDSPSAPARVVQYMVFHEMLHARFPIQRNGGRRVIHSAAFREAERQFPGFDQIRRQLKHWPD